jgi:hypothetical protein
VIQATPDINDASAKRFHLYDERIATPPKIRPHGRAYQIQCFAHVNVPFVEEHFQFVEGWRDPQVKLTPAHRVCALRDFECGHLEASSGMQASTKPRQDETGTAEECPALTRQRLLGDE